MKYSDRIINRLSPEAKSIAIGLHSAGFVSQQILDETLELEETNADKGRRLYRTVLEVVRHFPHRYRKFLAILHEHTNLDNELMEILTSTCTFERPLLEQVTFDELCSLPVQDIWYPLGLWLGIEERVLQKIQLRHTLSKQFASYKDCKEYFPLSGGERLDDFQIPLTSANIQSISCMKDMFREFLNDSRTPNTRGYLLKALLHCGQMDIVEKKCNLMGKL